MFGKFGGIVIIALSIVIVAGLILRSTPEHPAALSLGITDNKKVATETAAETPKPEEKAKESDASEEQSQVKEAEAVKEETESNTVETIKESVTSTVDKSDEVVGVVKETVEKQVETKSE